MLDHTEGHEHIGAIIAEYLKAEAAGCPPARETLLEQYPECADELTVFFADHDAVRGLANRMTSDFTTQQAETPSQQALAETIDPEWPVGETADISAPQSVQVPGYEVVRELGRGGMGVVYQARHLGLNRLVALKMILAGGHAAERDVQRFLSEADAVAAFSHPNIVQVYDFGQHNNLPYLALELVTGGSLADKLKERLLPAKQTAHWAEQLARGMNAAHQAGIVHRDLKPDNVLLTEDGTPKVTDFGLAKKVEGGCGLTQTGAIMGTPSYMAPEQARGEGKRVGPAADVYALGAILYACLTGRPPFQANSVMETLLQVMQQEPIPPRVLNKSVPADLETICLKCLEKDPFKRFASAHDLAEDLRSWQAGEPISARPVGLLERGTKWIRRHAVVSALAAVAVLAMLAGMVVSSYFAYTANQEAIAAWIAEEKAGEEARAAREAENKADARARAEARAKALAEKERKRAEAERARAERQLTRAEWLVYAHKLLLAQSAFAKGDCVLALEYLNECQWNLRGWEHHHLWGRFNSKQTLRGHKSRVSSVAFSPDGQSIVTGSLDHTAKLWDAEQGHEIRTLKGHAKDVTSVAFSPDGNRVVTASADKTAKVWNTHNGKLILSLQGHTAPLNSVAFSPDGKRVATGSTDRTVKLWDTENGQALLTLSGHTSYVGSVAYSPDGKRIVSCCGFGRMLGEVKVWDARTGRELLSFRGHAGSVRSVAFSPDSQRIVTGSSDKTAKVWDAHHGQPILTLKGHSGLVASVDYSPDGKYIATGSRDGTAKLWNAWTGQELFSLNVHMRALTDKGQTRTVTGVAFSPDGRRLVTGSSGTAKVWDANNGQEIPSLHGHFRGVNSVAFGPDSQRIVTGSGDRTAKVWDVRTGQALLTLRGHLQGVYSVAFSSDGQRIVTGGGFKEGETKVWDARTGRELRSLNVRAARVYSVAFSPDGKRIATGAAGAIFRLQPGELTLWDATTGRRLFTVKDHKQTVFSVAFSPDSKRVASGSFDKTAKVWDARTGQELLCLKGHSAYLTCVAFSSDGKRIGTASGDRTAKVWDARTGQELLTLKGHRKGVTSLAFSPDGQRIVTVSSDKMVKIWSVETGQEVLSLEAHTDQVGNVAWSPDGQRIVTCSYDKTAKVWNALTRQRVFLLQGHTHEVQNVAWSPDGKHVVSCGGANQGPGVVKVWDVNKGQELLFIKGHPHRIQRVAFSADGKQIFAWDARKTVLAWSAGNGKPADPTHPPAMPLPGPVRSPDGLRRAEPRGKSIAIINTRLPGNDNAWPLPDLAERTRYHGQQAARAEKQKQWFGAAFHLSKVADCSPWDAHARASEARAWQKAGQQSRAAIATVQYALAVQGSWIHLLQFQSMDRDNP